MGIDYRKIFYFRTVAQQGSFQGASRILRVAQPAISKAIKEMEQDLGVKVFLRTHTGVKLTSEGKKLFRTIQPLVDELEKVDAHFFSALSLDETLTIAHFGPGPLELLKPFLDAFKRLRPSVKIEFEKYFESEVLNPLKEGACDLAVVAGQLVDSDCISKVIGKQKLMVVLPKTHRLQGQKSLSPYELNQERIILPSAAKFPYLSSKIIKLTSACHEMSFTESESDNLVEIIFQCGLLGRVAILPEPLSRTTNPSVVFADLESNDIFLTLSLAWNPQRINNVCVDFLRGLL